MYASPPNFQKVVEFISEIWSYSKLNTFETCPYAYWLNYVAKDPPINEENAFSQYGSFVHEILEKYFKGELELFELSTEYEDNFDDNILLDFPYCESHGRVIDLCESYHDKGLAYLENFDGLPEYKILGVEEDFVIEILNGEKLRGFIDLILEDKNGNIIVLDHKSKSKFKSKEEQKHYSFQPVLYSIYVHEKYGKWPDRVVFNMFRQQKYVKIKFTQELLQEALNWVESTISKIYSCEDFLPKFTKKEKEEMLYFCRNICGYKSSCKHQLDYIDENGEIKMFGVDAT